MVDLKLKKVGGNDSPILYDVINLATGGVGGTIRRVNTFAGPRFEAYRPGNLWPRKSNGQTIRCKCQFPKRSQAVAALMMSYGINSQGWAIR